MLIILFFSALGKIPIVGRANLKNTQLDISDVKETDAGKFICLTDKIIQDYTLLVVASKQWHIINYSIIIQLFLEQT